MNIKFCSKFSLLSLLIIMVLSIIYSCGGGGGSPNYLNANITFTPWTISGYSGCDTYMSFDDNIERIEVDVFTISSDDQPIPWPTDPHQVITSQNGWGSYTIKVPESGIYSITLRVTGKCSDCCTECFPQSTKGRPIYKGNSNLIEGSIIPDIRVEFVYCECCDL